ncbi:ABCG2, partial [Symbiodinium microadriaticum]
DDIHIATLTVEETIRYAAQTRMTEGTTPEQHEQRVKFLLDMMGISHVKDSLIGDPLHKGISGGQLKRLSIAVEIAVLLSNGFLLYAGAADEAVSYFTRPALGYKYDPDQNPAEFIIDVCGGLVNPEGSDFPRLPDELVRLYQESDFVSKPQEALSEAPEPLIYSRRHATTKLTQFKMLMHRGWMSLIRDKADTKAGIAKNFIIGTLIGIVFWKQ